MQMPPRRAVDGVATYCQLQAVREGFLSGGRSSGRGRGGCWSGRPTPRSRMATARHLCLCAGDGRSMRVCVRPPGV